MNHTFEPEMYQKARSATEAAVSEMVEKRMKHPSFFIGWRIVIRHLRCSGVPEVMIQEIKPVAEREFDRIYPELTSRIEGEIYLRQVSEELERMSA